jgi:SAM-dependent methyltransferase
VTSLSDLKSGQCLTWQGTVRAAVESHVDAHGYPTTFVKFEDATFDMVTAIEVLEHVADLDGTLAEVHRVLRPGGRFCVTTPNRWFPFETHGPVIAGKRRRSWVAPGLPWVAPLHRRWSDARAFTKGGLSRQAASHGLTLVGVEWMMPPFDRNGLGKRIRPFTDWVERGPLAFFGMALVLVFEKR